MLIHKVKTPLYSRSTPNSFVSLCPTMDLIAFVNNTSSTIVVYRSIDWEKLQIRNCSNNCTGAMAWKPDGKKLAIGLENGTVALLSMEDYSTNLNMDDIVSMNHSSITCLY